MCAGPKSQTWVNNDIDSARDGRLTPARTDPQITLDIERLELIAANLFPVTVRQDFAVDPGVSATDVIKVIADSLLVGVWREKTAYFFC